MALLDSKQLNPRLTGSFTLSGSLITDSASTGSFGHLNVAGNTNLVGDLTLGGNIQIGDSSGDSITIGADLTSNIIPNTDSTYDLGTTEGDLTAQRYIVSSSVTHMTTSFASGSTIFGDDSDDNHRFTGSLRVTGSLNVDKGRIFEQGTSVIDHATAMAIVFGG